MRIDLPLPSILFPALPRTAPRPLRRTKRVETLCLGQRDAQAVVTKTKQMRKKKRPDLAATFSPLHPTTATRPPLWRLTTLSSLQGMALLTLCGGRVCGGPCGVQKKG